MEQLFYSSATMIDDDLGFDDIFNDVCPDEFNEFGLRREMRFISERIIAEYDPSDHLSVREIMHPMDAYRTKDPYFRHKLVDKKKHEFVTAIDFHEHITYFPYAKSTGDICLARYISNFNDINFTKISGQDLCSLPGETIYGVRVGRLDKGMLAANHRTGDSVNSTVTIIDLVRPARTIAHYDSPIPVNTIDWVWHSPFLLAVGDDKSLRIMDARCPKAFNAVFFEGGVQKTAICSTRPLEIACWNGSNVLLYDVRRPDVPCAIYDIGLKETESIYDMKFNPYVTDELFIHTNHHRVYALKVNPAHLIGGKAVSEKIFHKWQVITFKHIDRGCTASRHSEKRRTLMPYEEEEIPLHDYFGQYEASKLDPQVPVPNHWRHPAAIEKQDFKKLSKASEVDYESYLYKAVERVSADPAYATIKPKVCYQANGVETFDFVFPGVNGIMCFDRQTLEYKIVRSPKHYEGSINPYTGSDAVHMYRTIQIREMIPAQTLTMICNRLENGWDAYQTTEQCLKDLAFTITEDSENLWSHWLRNSVIMQYDGSEFAKVGRDGLKWNELVSLPKGALPVPEIPPYDYANEHTSAEEICQMVAPFFRLFLPDPRPDLFSDSDSETDEQNAPPPNPYEIVEPENGMLSGLSYNMRTLCKCHAKMRYYNKKQTERKYMYSSMGNTFFIGASKRIREKFFKLGWKEITKPQILAHRLLMDTKVRRRKPIDELSKFQRFRAREFQKRVLPPKLITETSSVLMKPEYVREREQREKEMKERNTQPITAPIGMSMPKTKDAKKAPVIPDVTNEEDPERARFLIRAAIQLADNNSSDDEVPAPPPQTTPTPPPPPPPSAAAVPIRGPQATSTRNEKDDFEYETAEDAYFGIKKKRMYVVYQPATVPLNLRRYKPVRLRENTFVRRLEHLMYWGRRRHERDILYGRFEENDKRQSSVKERYTLDLKLALNNHMKVGWQTFYDFNFFFSNKCSYNQILRKAIQLYNRMFEKLPSRSRMNNVTHERMLFGIKPRYILGSEEMEEILELRQNCTMIENPLIDTYNQFMNYLHSQMPYKFGNYLALDDFHGDCPLQLEAEIPIEKVKQTAVYDMDEKFMYPTGKIRFCEFDIPPHHMKELEQRRLPVPPKKKIVSYLEDLEPPPPKVDYSGLRRTKSCPDLLLDVITTRNYVPHDVMMLNTIRSFMGNGFLKEFKEPSTALEYYVPDNYEPLSSMKKNQLGIFIHLDNKIIATVMEATKFIDWDSPMIADTDRKTGVKFMRRVVPFKEPQPPRQMVNIDPWFDFIPLETLQDAERTINVTYIYNDPPLFTWPGLQVLDEGRFQMFTLCPKVPRPPARPPPHYYRAPLDLPNEEAEFYTKYFTETMLLGHHPSHNRVRTPIYDELSINIPHSILDLLKPVFYGFFITEKQYRYNDDEVYEMNTRRELQQAILERRIITFREPVIEETEQELEIEENVNVEEDDLKTTSEESEGEENTVRNTTWNTSQNQIEESSEEELDSGDEAFGFWKMFAEKKKVLNNESQIKRKLGMFQSVTEEPVYTRFNPHTRANMRKISMEEEERVDEPRILGTALTKLYDENRIKEKRVGDCPLGSPKKSNIKINHPEHQPIVGSLTGVTKQQKSVSWGKNTEHHVPPPLIRYINERTVEVDRKLFPELYEIQLMLRRIKNSKYLPKPKLTKTKSSRKNSDPTVVSYKGLPRRSSLDQFYKKDAISTCSACIQEPWPTKEACIVCKPDTAIYRCSNITKLRVRCQACRSNIYKFSCSNYEYYSQYSNKLAILMRKNKLRPIDEKFKEQLTVENKVERPEDTPAVWNIQDYKSGARAIDSIFMNADKKSFSLAQGEQLSGYYQREFHWVCWSMDEDRAEKVIVSEEFDIAFDRDADIDMMRDTMNTISQDGEMDMMTTYDQRTGMRVRRWISYAALATRVQKQSDKARFRKKVADREARILAGEIAVKPAVLEEIKQKAKDKEEAATKATEMDEQKKAEEKRRQYKLWKKLPIPAFPEDTRKDMPNFQLPKSEDWLESSGSEDELPPIRSRILSKEMKEFIETIRAHMERKPKNFDGLKVTYGKLFEKRPILKNDIVLVTKKKNLRRRPPPFRIQRIPLEESWLNNAITVNFVPQAFEPKHEKNPMKWTIPFYSSEVLELSAKETRDRTFRPPTPPLAIKEIYAEMKSMEKSFYYHKRAKSLVSLRKAKTARQLRFHRKIYGRNTLPKKSLKAWTTAYHRAIEPKPKPTPPVSTPHPPGIPDYKKYIFSYIPKKAARRIRLNQRVQSRLSSSSDIEYCPIVRVPQRVLMKKRAKVVELERDPSPEPFKPVSMMKKFPHTGELKERRIHFVETPPSLSEDETTSIVEEIEEIIVEQSPEEEVIVEEEVKPERNPAFDYVEDKSIDNFSQGTPAITLLREVDRRQYRNARKREPKKTTSSSPIVDIHAEISKMKREKREKRQKKVEKHIPERARSAPLPIKRKSSDEVPIGRSFSVDSGARCKRALKIIAHKHKKAAKKSKRLEAKKTEHLVDAAVGEVVTIASGRAPAEVQTRSRKRPLSHSPERKKWTKTRSIPVSKGVKDTLVTSMSMAKALQSSRAKGYHTKRPLQPRWLPTDHETGKSEMQSDSHYQFQHMRFKRYTRKRKILHMEPIRARVLNTIRKIHIRKQDNQKMKYRKPMVPVITDMFLNPWEPLLAWPSESEEEEIVEDEESESDKEEKEAEIISQKPNPMSWKQMLAKLADYKVSIKRIRLTKLHKLKREEIAENAKPPQKLLEIVVEPTNNLKSCIQRKGGRRSLLYTSTQPKEKENTFLGFNNPLKLFKTPTSAPTPPIKKLEIVDPVTELSNPTIHQDTWLTKGPKPPSTKEEKPVVTKTESEEKPSVVLQESPVVLQEKVVVQPVPPPAPAKITLVTPDPALKEKSDESEDDTASMAAPPPKVPLDQQWRAAMMARRYMGSSKAVVAPAAKKMRKKEKELTDASSTSKKEEGSDKKIEEVQEKPVKEITVASEPETKNPSAVLKPAETKVMKPAETKVMKPVETKVAKPAEPKPAAAATVPAQLTRMPGTKVKENKIYEQPVAKPKATAPPPITPKPAASRKEAHSWGSDSSDDSHFPTVPSTSGTPSVSEPKPSTSEEKEKKKEESSSKPEPTPTEVAKPVKKPNPPPKSFFSAIFGRKKFPPLSITTTETPETADSSKTSPVLPHIKKPETGQLMKRSPTSDTPRHPPIDNDATIVKFVDGKPIADLAPVNFAMSQRRRNKTTSGTGSRSGSSSGSGSDNDEPNKKASTTVAPPPPKLTSALKPSASDLSTYGEGTSTQGRFPSGKSVRFGTISYEPTKPPTPPPPPVVIPTPEPRPEISFETLAEEMIKEQKRQKEEEDRKRRLEQEALIQQEMPPVVTVEPVVETKPPPKARFFNLNPFGKINPKKETTPPISSSNQPSTSTPTTSSLAVPHTGSNSQSPEKSDGASSSVPRKTSLRRQRMSDEELPKPAKPEPEEPPQLEAPKGVQKYDPVSQRKYYTRHGQEWKPPRKRVPLAIPPLRPLPPRSPEPEPEPLPAAMPPPLVPAEKQKKRKKREPEPVEVTLVLDGTEHFKKLTAENLSLLNREFDVEFESETSSLEVENDEGDDTVKMSNKEVTEKYRELIGDKSVEEFDELFTFKTLFHPKFNDSVITTVESSKKAPKYETASHKLKRLEKRRLDKIQASGIHSLSKRESAINAIRHVKKVKFFLTHKKKMLPPLPTDFKPKSILKPPQPPVTWFYRVDCEGNKIYLNRFGPSEWQKKMDEKLNPTVSLIKKKKKRSSYLQTYFKIWSKVQKKKIEDLVKAGKLKSRELERPKETKPADILIEFPVFNDHPVSRSLSWTTVSTNASLNSLLDALNAVDSSANISTMVPAPESGSEEIGELKIVEPTVIEPKVAEPSVEEPKVEEPKIEDPKVAEPKAEKVRSESESNERESPEPELSKQYPVVYVGATVGRSPSTSVSAVNLIENEAYSSVAQDGSEILEYVGQEEEPTETVKRRFDPFVRPISALFNALGGSATEVGTDAAASRSRPTERTFGGLFRRSSPPMPEFSIRPVSESPTRNRVRLPVTSISQGSSAEDILALMQEEPNALEKMEEVEVKKEEPVEILYDWPKGTPMWRKEAKLRRSLFAQFEKLKEESAQRKMMEYLDHHYSTQPPNQFSVLKSLVTFDLNRYMKTNKYPRPYLDINLLGKYDPSTIQVYSNSRTGVQRTSAIILKKIKECQERIENAKKQVQSKATSPLPKKELAKQAKEMLKRVANKRRTKIPVLYKFKRTCIKYRVKVTVKKNAIKLLKTDKKEVEEENASESIQSTIPVVEMKSDAPKPKQDEIIVDSDIEEDVKMSDADDYDGDNDDDLVNEKIEWVAASNPAIIRKNQKSKLLRKYFYFAVKMARKVSRKSRGVKKPFLFYAFVSRLRARLNQFMNIRRKDTRRELKRKNKRLNGTKKRQKSCRMSYRKRENARKANQKPFLVRHALKHGDTTQKQVIVEQSKFNFRKINAKLETFFECLDEYIDVGTPIKLMFRSKNTYLPKKMFDTTKKPLVDPVYYTSPTPCNTDSDFSDFSADNEKIEDTRQFFERESLESTYHVKGLPGLLYLARLVQERVGEDIERSIPFSGPGMESSKLIVHMTPIRRLMLNSVGLRMPDRVDVTMLTRTRFDNIEVWFTFLFKMLCYGRGDLCKFIIDQLALAQGPPNKKYDNMDLMYQAHVVHKLYKKMIYMANGREAKLAIQDFLDLGIEVRQNPLKKPFKLGVYDHMLPDDVVAWTRRNWLEACEQFLSFSTTKESVLVTCQGSIILMRMIFTGGHSQSVVDQLIPMGLPVRDKLLFIINLSPPENIVENMVKMFHTVRGLDRLPFVGLGYHADPLRVLFEEACESGDPQLIAHFIRIGRCLDRRSREPMMTDCGSEHIQNRDFGNIMCNVFNNGKERRPFGAPTMDEMFPFRYVLHSDGTEVTETTEELAQIMECEVTRYMAILELTKGAAMAKGDLDHNPRFSTYPNRFFVDVVCTGCKTNVCKGRNLGRLGRTLCVSTMPLIEQDKDRKRWPNAKTMSPRLTFENYIETLDPTENKMLMAKDIEEEKTDITVQVLPSRFGCFQCRFSLPRCVVCMCPYLNDHMDFALKEFNERYSQFSVCNICNHGGHVSHIAQWFESEKFCPVAGCDCKCQRPKYTKNLKGKLRRHMLLSANMRAKSHLCNPECAMEADIDEGYLPDPDLDLINLE